MVSPTNILIKTSIVQTWKSFNRGLTNRPPPNPVVSDVRSLMRSGTCPPVHNIYSKLFKSILFNSSPPLHPTPPLSPYTTPYSSSPTPHPQIHPTSPHPLSSPLAFQSLRLVTRCLPERPRGMSIVNCLLSKLAIFPFHNLFKYLLTFCLLSPQASHL